MPSTATPSQTPPRTLRVSPYHLTAESRRALDERGAQIRADLALKRALRAASARWGQQ